MTLEFGCREAGLDENGSRIVGRRWNQSTERALDLANCFLD